MLAEVMHSSAHPMARNTGPLTNASPINVDFIEAGSVGPVVMLVHSSVSGARQWRRLMEDLKGRFRVRAVNLFGYGQVESPYGSGEFYDYIHEMLNVTQKNTVEIHVYGKDLANMKRLRFDPEQKTVKFFASPKYDNC